MRHVAPAILAVAAMAVAGCEAAPVSTNTTRDSLGVTIVESVAHLWATRDAWRVEEEPILDLAETGSGGVRRDVSDVEHPQVLRLVKPGQASIGRFN